MHSLLFKQLRGHEVAYVDVSDYFINFIHHLKLIFVNLLPKTEQKDVTAEVNREEKICLCWGHIKTNNYLVVTLSTLKKKKKKRKEKKNTHTLMEFLTPIP